MLRDRFRLMLWSFVLGVLLGRRKQKLRPGIARLNIGYAGFLQIDTSGFDGFTMVILLGQ